MASSASALSLQNSILLMRHINNPDDDVCDTSMAWTNFSVAQVPPSEIQHIQKVWEQPIVDNQLADISSKLSSDVDKVRILSISSSPSGDWLMTLPERQVDWGWATKWYELLLASDWNCTLVSYTLVHVEKKWMPVAYTAYLADEVSTAAPCRFEWHYLKISKTWSYSCFQRASRFDKNQWEMPWWCYTKSMVSWQTASRGVNKIRMIMAIFSSIH